MEHNLTSLVNDRQYFLEMYEVYRNMVGSQRGFNERIAKKYNLTGQERYILAVLYYEPGASKKRIAEFMSVLMPSITKSIERLEKKGLIEKGSCGNDGRVCKHYATEKGKELNQILIDESHNIWIEAFKDLSPEKVETFKEIMSRLQCLLDKTEAE